MMSALHKSLRNSDPDAALYWLARMLEAGEDPMYVARRLVRFASEDVGLADPQALPLTVAASAATHQLGMPEANTALAQAAVYLATAPKSNAVYAAYGTAARDATEDVAEPVPAHLRNAPTRLMKTLGYGKGYEYAHDAADAITGHGLPARAPPGPALLPADRPRLREDPRASGSAAGPSSSVSARRRQGRQTPPARHPKNLSSDSGVQWGVDRPGCRTDMTPLHSYQVVSTTVLTVRPTRHPVQSQAALWPGVASHRRLPAPARVPPAGAVRLLLRHPHQPVRGPDQADPGAAAGSSACAVGPRAFTLAASPVRPGNPAHRQRRRRGDSRAGRAFWARSTKTSKARRSAPARSSRAAASRSAATGARPCRIAPVSTPSTSCRSRATRAPSSTSRRSRSPTAG